MFKAVGNLALSVVHPYISTVRCVDYTHAGKDTWLVAVEGFAPHGSLKDLIYNNAKQPETVCVVFVLRDACN